MVFLLQSFFLPSDCHRCLKCTSDVLNISTVPFIYNQAWNLVILLGTEDSTCLGCKLFINMFYRQSIFKHELEEHLSKYSKKVYSIKIEEMTIISRRPEGIYVRTSFCPARSTCVPLGWHRLRDLSSYRKTPNSLEICSITRDAPANFLHKKFTWNQVPKWNYKYYIHECYIIYKKVTEFMSLKIKIFSHIFTFSDVQS